MPLIVAAAALIVLDKLHLSGQATAFITLALGCLYSDLVERAGGRTLWKEDDEGSLALVAHAGLAVTATVGGLALQPSWNPAGLIAAVGLFHLTAGIPLLCTYWWIRG